MISINQLVPVIDAPDNKRLFMDILLNAKIRKKIKSSKSIRLGLNSTNPSK